MASHQPEPTKIFERIESLKKAASSKEQYEDLCDDLDGVTEKIEEGVACVQKRFIDDRNLSPLCEPSKSLFQKHLEACQDYDCALGQIVETLRGHSKDMEELLVNVLEFATTAARRPRMESDFWLKVRPLLNSLWKCNYNFQNGGDAWMLNEVAYAIVKKWPLRPECEHTPEDMKEAITVVGMYGSAFVELGSILEDVVARCEDDRMDAIGESGAVAKSDTDEPTDTAENRKSEGSSSR